MTLAPIDDIQNYAARAQARLQKLKQISLCEEDREDILRFLNTCVAEGLKPGRILKYAEQLPQLSKWLKETRKIPFRTAGKEDIVALVAGISQRECEKKQGKYSPRTVNDYKIALKRFYQFLRGCERKEYPPEVRWIRSSMSFSDSNVLPEDIISAEESYKLIDCVPSLRDKALISVLFEGCLRIGELLSMRVKDVEFTDNGCKLSVRGKTGERKILLIPTSDLLQKWINAHPLKADQNAPLWVTFRKWKNHEFRRMGITAVFAVIQTAAEKAGIQKHVYPHLFRHSGLTYKAHFLKDAELKAFAGWRMSSKMAGVYIHLAGEDIDKSILQMHGIAPPKEEGKASRQCPRCKKPNRPDAVVCDHCWLTLDDKTALEVEKKKREFLEMLDLYMKNPSIREEIDQELTLK